MEATESRGWGQGRAECFLEALNEREDVSRSIICAPVPRLSNSPLPSLQHLLVGGRVAEKGAHYRKWRGAPASGNWGRVWEGSVQGICYPHHP